MLFYAFGWIYFQKKKNFGKDQNAKHILYTYYICLLDEAKSQHGNHYKVPPVWLTGGVEGY